MYWLRPPNLVRRAAAVLLVVGAIVWDLAGSSTSPYAVAAGPIPAGATITPELVAWIQVPSGLLAPSDPIGAVAAVTLEAGEPIPDAVTTPPVATPDGWWTIPIAVGTLAAPGDEALLVVADPPISVVGIVVAAQVGDPYDLDHRPAAVAVPPDAAPVVAAAEQEGLLVAAIRPSTPGR